MDIVPSSEEDEQENQEHIQENEKKDNIQEHKKERKYTNKI